MADDAGSSAGYLSLEFKAEIDALTQGFEKAQFSLDSFSMAVEDSAEKVTTAGRKISAAFDDIGGRTLRAEERFARFGAQMLATQFAIQAMSQSADGAFRDLDVAVQAGAQGIERFVMIFGAFPSYTSATLGTLAALIAGYGALAKGIEEVTKKQDALNKKIAEKTAADIVTLAKQDTKDQALPGAAGDVDQALQLQQKRLEDANLWMRQYTQAVDQASVKVPQLDARIKELNATIGVIRQRQSEMAPGDQMSLDYQLGPLQAQIKALANQKIAAEDQIHTLDQSLKTLGVDVQEPAKGIAQLGQNVQTLKEAFKDITATQGIDKISEKLSAMGELGQKEIELGLSTPLKVAQKDLQSVEASMEKILQYQLTLEAIANKVAVTDPELANTLRAQAGQLGTTLGVLQGRGQNDKSLIADQTAIDTFSKDLSTSIGSAVTNGILSGQSAMQTLANVGTDMFKKMMQDATKELQTGMESVFNSLLGPGSTGGGTLAGLLEGTLGILGGIFGSKAASKTSYSSIQNAVTSNQVVRGIVAGPTSVSIADVQADLTAAFVPTNQKLDYIGSLLAQLVSRSGGAGSGPMPFAGTVPA
ncbi:MAG TPA: hypothetical protein VG457_16970 [Planctomycetota bacterium]|nr:hypothetical protein [Planctomycetota bacterium]